MIKSDICGTQNFPSSFEWVLHDDALSQVKCNIPNLWESEEWEVLPHASFLLSGKSIWLSHISPKISACTLGSCMDDSKEILQLTFRSRCTMLQECRYTTPSRICFRNPVASCSFRDSFWAKKSNSSPPDTLWGSWKGRVIHWDIILRLPQWFHPDKEMHYHLCEMSHLISNYNSLSNVNIMYLKLEEYMTLHPQHFFSSIPTASPPSTLFNIFSPSFLFSLTP